MRKNYRRRKFNRKRKNTFKIFFLVIVGMTLGFAAINTTLQLIGTLNISRTTWNIHWENPTKTGGVSATKEVALKENDNTTVEYQVKLTNPGDYYEFTVDAKNDGTIDGMITNIQNKVYENNTEVTLPNYLESTITYSDGTLIENNHLLASSKKETYKVKVAYKTGLAADELPDSEKTYNFRFTVTYMQADEATAKPVKSVWTLPVGKTRDNLEIGDELCVSDQCFNFIKYDGNDLIILAKYNLKVGQTSSSAYISPGASGSGKQDSSMIGSNENNAYIGSVAFSANKYYENMDLTSKTYIYNKQYNTAPNFSSTCNYSTNCWYTPNYSIAYYVEAYKEILEGSTYNATIKDIRLLKYEEAINDIGCSNKCPTDNFITNTSFWLGTTYTGSSISTISTNGYIYGKDYFENAHYGVRPVIVITKSSI